MPSLEVFSLTDYYLKNTIMYYVVFDFFYHLKKKN